MNIGSTMWSVREKREEVTLGDLESGQGLDEIRIMDGMPPMPKQPPPVSYAAKDCCGRIFTHWTMYPPTISSLGSLVAGIYYFLAEENYPALVWSGYNTVSCAVAAWAIRHFKPSKELEQQVDYIKKLLVWFQEITLRMSQEFTKVEQSKISMEQAFDRSKKLISNMTKKLEEKDTKLESTVKNLKDTKEGLSSSIATYENYKKEIDELTEQLEKLQGKKNQLSETANSIKETVKELGGDIGVIEGQVKRFDEENDQRFQQLQQFIDHAKKMKDEATTMGSEVSVLKGILEKLNMATRVFDESDDKYERGTENNRQTAKALQEAAKSLESVTRSLRKSEKK